jgi:hydrogenase nickel incorporation protein HypB
MCGTCGCGSDEARIEGAHHVHAHHHAAPADQTRVIQVERDILAKNDAHAAENRAFLAARSILALNLVSSPGSGKTALLVRTIGLLGERLKSYVVEGDQQTSNDADRIRAAGAPAVQINTGKGCHLEAHMVGHAIGHLSPEDGSLVFVENVGNLVCPAGFDLGEAHRVVIMSVTEGEDKPLKYPDIFSGSDLVLMNKVDLLPHLDFDMEHAIGNMRRVNPDCAILPVSARTGEGLEAWIGWIDEVRTAASAVHPAAAE